MKRFIARWLISSAIDSDRELPDWVQRQLQTDPVLRAWHAEVQGMVQQLQGGADAWANGKAGQTNQPPIAQSPLVQPTVELARSVRVPAVVKVIAALAASLLVIVAVRSGVEKMLVQRQNAADLQPLLTSWSAGQRVVQRQAERTSNVTASISRILNAPASLKADLARETKVKVEGVGQSYGQVIERFSQSMRFHLLGRPPASSANKL